MKKASTPQNESTVKTPTSRQIAEVENTEMIRQSQHGLTAISGAVPSEIPLTPQTIRYLHRKIGNKAVEQLIQAKLTIGKPNDKYEQEADRVADQVMQMPEPSQSPKGQNGTIQAQAEEEEMLQAQPLAGQISPLVQREMGEKEEMQTKPLIQRQGDDEEELMQAKADIQNEGAVQRFAIIQRVTEYEEKVVDLQQEFEKLWSEDDKKEAILKAIENVYTSEKAVEATKDPAVVKAVLAFVNSKQSESWKEGTIINPPGKRDIGKLPDAENWTLRHYTDKYVWDENRKEVKPPSYREILSTLTLAAMGRGEKGGESDESTPVEKSKVGASKSGHTSKIDWEIIGNVGDTFYGLFYKGKLAGQHQTFLNKAQWYAEWKIGDVSEIWASSDWLGTAKSKKAQPRGEAYEGKPEDVISSFLGMMGRRGDDEAKRKVFESGFDNFEVKVHGSLKLDDSSVSTNWQRVDNPPETEEQKALKK